VCGIAGALALDFRTSPDVAGVERMTEALLHRGPDDSGLLVDGPIALGHRRLSILDTSPAGRQPMRSADGRHAIVLNGEIYNYRPLRDELARGGAVFRTGTDTEVALAAYVAHGLAFLERLEGMFALAVWDAERGRLVLARDPVGIKPLYVSVDGGVLRFASELRALLLGVGRAPALDPGAVAGYFARQYVAGEASIVRGVARLPAGTALVATAGGISRAPFWRYPAPAPDATPAGGGGDAPGPDPAPRFLEVLSDAVRSHLQSDVPVGVFLSGGIDSSVVAALLRRHGVGALPAFTVSVEGEGGVDETAEARRAADAAGLAHHAIRFGPREALEWLPRVAAALDEPLADYALLPTYLLAREARRSVTVVLTGEGADELLGGYPRYLHYLRCARRARIPWIGAHARRECADYRATRLFDREGLARLLAPIWGTLGGDAVRGAALLDGDGDGAAASAAGPPDLVNRMLAIDFTGWLPDDLLAKVDRATMLASLEARVPYLDKGVVECVAALPGRYKIAGRTLKALLREAAKDLVPAETVARPKHGFTVPVGSWLRGPLRDLLRDTLGSARFRGRGLVEPREVARLLDGLERRGENGLRAWSLLVFELWCRATLDAGAGAAGRG
jgi:asparagine synthase (glutamine-hydrolysing)